MKRANLAYAVRCLRPSGCIRMLNEDVVEVFQAAVIGTDVYVLGHKG